MSYLEGRQGLLAADERRRTRGADRVFARDVQTLVPVWGELTLSEANRVLGIVDEVLYRPAPRNAELEGAMALAACLLTGRTLADLYDARLTLVEHWPDEDPSPGLVRCNEVWGWLLPAGGPPTSRGGGVWLPAPMSLVTWVVKVLARCGRKTGNGRLFAEDLNDVRAAAQSLLRAPGLRRASTTLEAVQRWLGHRITQAAGGDAAVSAIVTGHASMVAKSSQYYTCCSQEAVVRFWCLGTEGLLADWPARVPPALLDRRFGSPFCPTDVQVARLRDRLLRDVQDARTTAERGDAFVRYAAVLLSLGMALRPAGRTVTVHPLPGQGDAVIVDDAREQNPMMTRMVWLTPVVRRQLDQLRRYAAACVGDSVPANRLALVLNGPEGPRRTTLRAVVANVLGEQGTEPLKSNFARHYMRSELLGRCGTETLQAFLGHWNNGTQPWGPASGLDPALYRADLTRGVAAVIDDRGWPAIRAPVA